MRAQHHKEATYRLFCGYDLSHNQCAPKSYLMQARYISALWCEWWLWWWMRCLMMRRRRWARGGDDDDECDVIMSSYSSYAKFVPETSCIRWWRRKFEDWTAPKNSYVILLYRTIPTIPEQHTYQTTNLCTTLDRIMVCTRGKILAIPLFGGDNQWERSIGLRLSQRKKINLRMLFWCSNQEVYSNTC